MNRLTNEKRVQIIHALVEGNSLRAASRLCDVAFNTVLKLLPEIGEACEKYQRRAMVNLPCKKIQCDEIWSFCYAKEKNVPEDKLGMGYGDVWTCGRGPRFVRTRNSFRLGASGIGTHGTRNTSCTIWPRASRTASS
jgi:hypothetical protein